METIFMNTVNNNTNEPHKFVFNSPQRLYLRNSNKHVTLQNISIYYTWKNIRQQYKFNKLKIIAPTWNDNFELPDGSYSVLHIDQLIKCYQKKPEALPTNATIHI